VTGREKGQTRASQAAAERATGAVLNRAWQAAEEEEEDDVGPRSDRAPPPTEGVSRGRGRSRAAPSDKQHVSARVFGSVCLAVCLSVCLSVFVGGLAGGPPPPARPYGAQASAFVCLLGTSARDRASQAENVPRYDETSG
jgi:hypothetical protein